MEQWDLYDIDRVLTGRTMTRGDAVPRGMYHLVTHICVFSPRGDMLIQKRAASKPLFPGRWDLSAGGAAVSGDNSRQCAERELREELGIRRDFSGLLPTVSLPFESAIGDIYAIEADIDLSSLTLQADEVERVRWAGKEDIHRMIDLGEFVPVRHAIVDLLFDMKFGHGWLDR